MIKTKLLFITMLLVSFLGFSQEVKVKKGEIQVNGKSIAKIDKKDGIYTISDLNNKPLFTAIITNRTPLKNFASKTWLQLTGTNNIVKELELMPTTGFSFGFEKPITENLTLGNDPLLPSSGVDEAKITSFFKEEDRSISTAQDIAIEKEKKIAKKEDSIAKINRLVIGNAGIISANGNKIGYIAKKTESTGTFGYNVLSYNILDINKFLVAKLEFANIDAENDKKGLVINTYDRKQIPVKGKYSSEKVDFDDLADRVVKKLYVSGYTLGDMKSMLEIASKENFDADVAENKAKEDKAWANSKNIREQQGYVITKDGSKKEGLVTIEFESINAKLGIGKNMSDLTNYGGSVSLKINDKYESYKAKDGIKFCAGTRCFIGTKGSEDGGIDNTSGSQLSILGESQFFEIQAENNENYVLNHVKNPQYYYLKLKNQDKAAYLGSKATFGTRKPEKIKKIFDEYVKCSIIDVSKYDTNTKEGLEQVLNDYQKSCK